MTGPGEPRRGMPAPRAGLHAGPPARRRRWPWILGGVLTGLLALSAAGAGLVYEFYDEAMSVRDELTAAKAEISGIPDALRAGDSEALTAHADRALALIASADETVQGPLWGAAATVPYVGQNVSAVRKTTEATHILIRDAMPPALELLTTLQVDKLKVQGGGIDLEPFSRALVLLPTINAAFAQAQARVADIDREQLHPVIDDAIGQLLSVIENAGPALAETEKHLPTALRMAGSSEPRTYIVLFQNNAETRATGGNTATSAIMKVDNGHVEMLDRGQTEQFIQAGIAGQTQQNIPPETRDLYEKDLTGNTVNYSRIADFPTVAQMFRAVWQQNMGGDVDGVISLDPVALSYLLAATGPITLGDGTQIASDNAVKLLLSDTYEKFGIDGEAADEYFAAVTAQVFAKLSSGEWDPATMLTQVGKAASEHRILAWFTRPDEQAVAVEQNIDGALTTDNAETTQVGVFLNDASYSKLEYYLSTSMDVTCDAAARTVTTALTMTSSVPGSNLSGYTLAWRNRSLGLPRTSMILDAVSFAVPGGTITSNPENGDISRWTRSGGEVGRAGKSITVVVPMGQTKTVSFTTTLPDGPLAPLEVRFTPTVTQTPVTVSPSCTELFPTTAG